MDSASQIALRMAATSTPTEDGVPASPLLRLPMEIRLMIYEYMLLPSTQPTTTQGTSVANLLPDFHTYFSEDTNNDPFTLSVRTIDPWLGAGAVGQRTTSGPVRFLTTHSHSRTCTHPRSKGPSLQPRPQQLTVSSCPHTQRIYAPPYPASSLSTVRSTLRQRRSYIRHIHSHSTRASRPRSRFSAT
jgi:hypothetical protein